MIYSVRDSGIAGGDGKLLDRCCFLKVTAAILMGLALMPLWGLCADTMPTARPPNIIVILADDMGFSDLGCYGSEIRTPNLDTLAQRGTRFRQMYNAARCCPTRASLLTGLYPSQTGIGYMWKDMGTDGYEGFMNDNCVTIAEALGQAGYRTCISGKWHVGKLEKDWPDQRGFEQSYSLINGATNFWGNAGTWSRNGESFSPTDDNFYATDAFTNEAVRMIDQSRDDDRPFFLYLAYTAPHWPLHARAEDIARYRERYRDGWKALRAERFERMQKMGVIDQRYELSPVEPDTTPWSSSQPREWEDMEDQDEWSLRMAVYAAMVDSMDQGIGRIMSQLDELGLAENTLVIFLSDNGASSEVREKSKPEAITGQHDSYVSYGLDWAAASNTPYRRFKRWTHEGGIITPMIASWPALSRGEGEWSDALSHVVDIMATCLDAAGVEYPIEMHGQKITPMEGRSFLPALRGEKMSNDRTIGWEHEGHCAIRKDRWKMVLDPEGKPQLFDLSIDPAEAHNLADQLPEKVTELRKVYDQWVERTNVTPFAELSVIVEQQKAELVEKE